MMFTFGNTQPRIPEKTKRTRACIILGHVKPVTKQAIMPPENTLQVLLPWKYILSYSNSLLILFEADTCTALHPY